jgi:HEAT repeat protein
MKRKTPEEYLQDLESEDLQTRLKSLDKLGKLGDVSPTAVDRVTSLLGDDNWKVRAGAARSLGNMGYQAEAAIPNLIEALDDKTTSVRSAAAVALNSLGEKSAPAIPMLIKSLGDSNWSVRVTACNALKSIGPSAVSAQSDLMKLLSTGVNFTEKYCAWEAIKAISANNHDKETLAKYVKSEDIPNNNPFVGRLKDRVTDKKPPTKKTVERYISELKDPDPKKKATAMRKLSDVICAKQEDLEALILPIIPDLMALLSDQTWKVRSWAARLLGRIGPKADAAVSSLVIALEDDMVEVRACAAYALGLLGGEATIAIPMLEKTLRDPNQHVRNSAHMAIRKLKNMEQLGPGINDDDELVYYHVDDDEFDIHYGVMGWKELDHGK